MTDIARLAQNREAARKGRLRKNGIVANVFYTGHSDIKLYLLDLVNNTIDQAPRSFSLDEESDQNRLHQNQFLMLFNFLSNYFLLKFHCTFVHFIVASLHACCCSFLMHRPETS